MNNRWLSIAAVFGFLGVAMGAFGTHGLKSILTPDLLTIFETGSRYCLIHAVVLLAVSILHQIQPSSLINRAGWLFSFGILIFSGTLWTLAITNTRWLGAITPVGGLCLLLGWGLLLWAGIKRKEASTQSEKIE